MLAAAVAVDLALLMALAASVVISANGILKLATKDEKHATTNTNAVSDTAKPVITFTRPNTNGIRLIVNATDNGIPIYVREKNIIRANTAALIARNIRSIVALLSTQSGLISRVQILKIT